jgi:hypothetical protein
LWVVRDEVEKAPTCLASCGAVARPWVDLW